MDASQGQIIELAKDPSNRFEELIKLKPKASHTAKSFIISYSYLMGLSPKQAVEELKELKYLKAEGSRATPAKEWRSLLRSLLGRKRGLKFENRD